MFLLDTLDKPGGQLLGRKQRILLEISAILFFFTKNAIIPLSQQIIFSFVAKKYNLSLEETANYSRHKWENELEKSRIKNESLNLFEEEGIKSKEEEEKLKLVKIVNEESNLVITYLIIAELMPTAFVVIFFGFLSDLTGNRKFMMYFPCLGNVIFSLGFILPFHFFQGDLSNTWTKVMLVLSSIFSGFSGSLSGFMSGYSSYVSDTEAHEKRTVRLALMELFVGTSFGVASLLNGSWIFFSQSFLLPLWIIFSLSLLSFFLILFFLHEPTGLASEELKSHNFNIKEIFKNISLFKRIFNLSTVSYKRLWLVFIAFQVYVFVQQGQERTYVPFFKGPPFFWDSFYIGIFLFIVYFLAGLGSWPLVPLLQIISSDVVIFLISVISKFSGSLLLALSTNLAEVYGAGVIQTFHLVPFAVARSIISMQVSDDEQGSIYGIIHSVQALASFLGPLAHTSLLSGSLESNSGLVFIISAGILFIPFICLIITYVFDSSEDKYRQVEKISSGKTFSPSSMTPLSQGSTSYQSYVKKENERKNSA